jgi:fermentation-respiration switch protein FrsA (DUF1100 family)
VIYEFAVAVYNEKGDVLRSDRRHLPNNGKPDEEWVAMVQGVSAAILTDATSQTPHHPFAADYRVTISRATIEEEATDASA